QDTRETYPGRQHGDNFVGPRHSTQSEKERQQKRNRQQNDQNLRNLRGVVTTDQKKTDALIDERRDIIAHVENEPDGDEPGDAVKINLQEIANDVSVEEFHCDLNGPVPITVLKSVAHAKSQEKRMTNSQ